MRFSGSRVQQPARLALLGAVLAVVALPARAGEPIRFSGRAGPAGTSEFDRREPLLPAEARVSRKSLPGADLQMGSLLVPSQAVTPTTGLTRRQAESLDQRRNWLLQSPDAILKQSTERGDEQGRDPRDEREPSKSAVERFLEGNDSKADPEQNTRQGEPKSQRERTAANNRSNPSRDSRNAQEHSASARNGEDKSGLEIRAPGGARGTEDNSFFSTADARSGSMNRAFGDARERERQRERDASLDDFKRTFSNPWAQGASAVGASASSPGGGGTAAASGIPGGDFRRPAGPGNVNPGARAPLDLGARGGFGDFDPKNPLNYGAPETVMKNNEPPRAAPKPVVLEIPKRKF